MPGRRFCQLQGCCERDGKEAAVTKCLFQLGSSLFRVTTHATGHVWSTEPHFEDGFLRVQLQVGLELPVNSCCCLHEVGREHSHSTKEDVSLLKGRKIFAGVSVLEHG
jgi:hypothetical protein